MNAPRRRQIGPSHHERLARPRHSAASARPSKSRSSGDSILSKDPFGLLWFGLLFLAVLVAKFWFISPPAPEDTSCYACAVGVMWIMTVLVFSLMTFLTILWSRKFEKGTAFVFVMCMMCVVCAVIDYNVALFVVRKLFYGGALSWDEANAEFLFNDFVPHTIALALVVSVFYTMVRIILSKDIVERNLVYTFGGIMILTTLPLMYLGIMLY